MPLDPAAEATFAAFIAKVPDAPSSAHAQPTDGETPPDPKVLETRRGTPDRTSHQRNTRDTSETETASSRQSRLSSDRAAEADADSPPPARAPKSAPRAKPVEPAVATDAKTPVSAPDPSLVLQALRDGDLDTIADLLGEDPAGFDEKTPKWAARQRKEAKVVAERDRVMRQAETVVERWSPVSRLMTERETNPAALFELVGLLTGQDPDAAWTAALRARGSVDPRVPVLTAAVADRDERLAKADAERAARVDAAFYETLRDEVDAKSVVRQIDGWEAKVADVLRESLDQDTGEPRLSTKQAADRVVRREREEYERRAKVFGGDERPQKKTRERAPERAGGVAGAKVRKLTREEWLAARSNG